VIRTRGVMAILLAGALLPSCGCTPARDWGRVAAARHGQNWDVVLENEYLLARYTPDDADGTVKDRITEFRLKSRDRSVANALDGRNATDNTAVFRVTKAGVERQDAERKTVRLAFDKRVEHVSILRYSPVLEIGYDQGGHNLDCGIAGTNYVFYGQDAWQQLRGWDRKHPKFQDQYDPTGSYYRSEWGGPGPLACNGWMIMGVYDDAGYGAGMLLPAAAVKWIKLVGWGDRWGFERWTAGPHKAYLFPVSGGAVEILAIGKVLAETMPK